MRSNSEKQRELDRRDGGGTGTGSGIVSLNVAANSATAARFGTVTIGGLTFILKQAGAVLDSRP